jgi:hypothetical protein
VNRPVRLLAKWSWLNQNPSEEYSVLGPLVEETTSHHAGSRK